MKILKSSLFEQFPELIFGFSTKEGLNRRAPYFFNMSLSVGDNSGAVAENRIAFFSRLALDPKDVQLQRQVHSDEVQLVNEVGQIKESDAMITDVPGIGLAVSTADCTNIFLFDSEKKVIAGIHSGWRSSRLRIVSKTMKLMRSQYGCESKNISAFLGPSIEARNYEVGAEFSDYFPDKYLSPCGGKFELDLKQFNFDLLTEAGVPENQIEVSPECSYENTELHSYRREGKNSGRALGVIAMRLV